MLGYVLEDLESLPAQPSVLVEGPQIVLDLLPEGARAVFLIPTADFQRETLSPRPMPSSDPQRALANRLAKDRIYADRVAELARRRGFPVIEVDGKRNPKEICAELERRFSGFFGASEPFDLAGARRWENEKIVSNVRSWIASGDHRMSNELPIPLACECGRLGCGERVGVTLSELDLSEPVLAPGHG